jgi:hypothetical protein
MPLPRAEATPVRTSTITSDAQSDLVRRYARMLRSASASTGVTRRGTGRSAEAAPGTRFTRPAAVGRRTDNA